jgi:hypothetical protein
MYERVPRQRLTAAALRKTAPQVFHGGMDESLFPESAAGECREMQRKRAAARDRLARLADRKKAGR